MSRSLRVRRNVARARLSPRPVWPTPIFRLTETAETRVINRRWEVLAVPAAADASAHTAVMNKMTKTGTSADPAEAVRRVYEREAGNYDQNVKLPERLLFAGGREWVCAQAEGEVLEIAVGTGRNLPHYPDGVRLTGIEFVPAMLEVARRRAVELGRPVELRLGDAQALEFEDATFDTVVCTLSLCTIPDDRAAVAEVRRVLRPGGRFVLLEHVRSPVRAVRGVQRLLAPAFVRFGADHLLREPLEHVQAEGFSIELLERSKLGLVERLLARKPGPG